MTALAVCLFAPGFAFAQNTEDADGDDWTVQEGDCDDHDPDVNPGIHVETCGDYRDNDCNGWYDDGCDYSVRQGTLHGGGGCTGNKENAPTPVGTAAMFAPVALLPGLRRRRQ